jgi:hypothetical protein
MRLAEMAGHEPSGIGAIVICLTVDKDGRAPARQIERCLAVPIGPPAKARVSARADIAEEIHKVGWFAINHPVRPGWSTKPRRTEIADFKDTAIL